MNCFNSTNLKNQRLENKENIPPQGTIPRVIEERQTKQRIPLQKIFDSRLNNVIKMR